MAPRLSRARRRGCSRARAVATTAEHDLAHNQATFTPEGIHEDLHAPPLPRKLPHRVAQLATTPTQATQIRVTHWQEEKREQLPRQCIKARLG